MKSGNKVSFSNSPGAPGRTFGTFVSEAGDGSVVAVNGPHDVNPLVLVKTDRVAAVNDKESEQEHTARVNEEARKAAKALRSQEQAKAVKTAAAATTAKADHSKSGSVRLALLVLVALIGVLVTPLLALDNLSTIRTTTYNYWSGGATNGASTLSWVIVPAHSSVASAAPVITSIDATTDKLAAKVQSYKVVESCVCTFTNATVSIPVNTTNTGSKWDSGTIVIRHLLTDQYEKRSLATSGGTTNLEVSAATLETVVPGDLIYKVVTTGAAAFTVSTNGVVAATGLSFVRLAGEALLVGQPGMPLLLEIDGTGANATLNNATAKYIRSALP